MTDKKYIDSSLSNLSAVQDAHLGTVLDNEVFGRFGFVGLGAFLGSKVSLLNFVALSPNATSGR